MATVWKHPHSPYWTAIYRDPKHRWRKKSTREKNRSNALRLALEWERLGERAREGRLILAECKKEVREIYERATGQKIDSPSVRKFFQKCLAQKQQRRYSSAVERFLDSLGATAEQSIDDVKPAHCLKYLAELHELSLAPATIALEWKIIRSGFRRAQREGLMPLNPTDGIELPKRLRQVRRNVFTHEEIEILLRSAPAEWQTATHLGYYAGLRLSDAISITFDNIDFLTHTLRFEVRKTGEGLTVPMHPSLEAHLLSLAADSPGPVCPTLSAVPVGGRSGLSKQFLSIMRSAGIDSEAVQTAGKRRLARRSFHSLRVTFNSTMHNQGVDQEIRKKLTGHKSDAVNDRYTKSELGLLSTAVGKLPSMAPAKSKQLELW
jgi:integrase